MVGEGANSGLAGGTAMPALTDRDSESTTDAIFERAKRQVAPPPVFEPMRQDSWPWEDETGESWHRAVEEVNRRRSTYRDERRPSPGCESSRLLKLRSFCLLHLQ